MFSISFEWKLCFRFGKFGISEYCNGTLVSQIITKKMSISVLVGGICYYSIKEWDLEGYLMLELVGLSID